MDDIRKSRYDLENLPISQKTKDGLTKENIEYIGAIGRMLSLQDDAIEEFLQKQTNVLNLRFDSIEKRLDIIEQGATEREKRLSYLEKRASLPYMVIRYGIVTFIGIIIGWILHSFL
jgi:hypothetical protein